MVLLCLAGAAPVAAGEEPSEPPLAGHLRLSDIFGGIPQPHRPGTIDPGGPVLLVPDTSAWRLPPPTPTPTPEPPPELPEGFDIPYLPPLIAAEDPDRDRVRQPAFTFRGLSPQAIEEGHALIRIDTTHTQLRTEYRLVREEAGQEEDDNEPGTDGGGPLLFLHAPRTAEQFAVPEGSYRLERRIWRPDFPGNVRREVYDTQRLDARGIYEFTTERDPESRWMSELRREPLQRATPGEPLPPAVQ